MPSSRPPTRARHAVLAALAVATLLGGAGLTSLAHAEPDPSPAEQAAAGVAPDRLAMALSLDDTGRTIPRTNYPIPTGAIFLATNGNDANDGSAGAPVATLNRAVALAPAGGTVVVRGGTYRDWHHDNANRPLPVTKQLTFQGYPGEQAWFDGTDIVPAGQWRSDGHGHWFTEWSTPNFCSGGYYRYLYNKQPKSNKGPCGHRDMANFNKANPAAADPQMAFVDGKQLAEVVSLAKVRKGSFYYRQDLARKSGQLYLGVDPGSHHVELAKRPQALILAGTNQTVRGLGFRRYATVEQGGANSALYIGAPNSLVESVTLTEMAGTALVVGSRGGVVRNSALVRNGFIGMGSNGHSETPGKPTDGLLIEGNLVSGNNSENFGDKCTGSCGQAGIKIAHMVGFTARYNIFERNLGSGFWCDNNCSGGVMVYNIARRNRIGLFYEVSNKGIIASNLVYKNSKTGIRVSSANTSIYNNTMSDNAQINLWVYDDDRHAKNKRGSEIGPNTSNVRIVNNILSGGNVTTMKLSRGSGGANTGPNKFVKSMDYNSYFRRGGPRKSLLNWVDSHGANYKSIRSLRRRHSGLEKHAHDISRGGDPFFVDKAHGKFAVRRNSKAFASSKALPADVAAALGVATGLRPDRGALSWPGR